MYTTLAIYSGSIKEQHKNLQTHPFDGGYAVEEKGLFMGTRAEAVEACKKRFQSEPDLLRVDVLGLTKGDSEVILRPS